MAGNNRYVFEVVSDWSQPERAVRQYAESARNALRSIQTAARAPAGGQRTAAQISATRSQYTAHAEGLGRQRGILEVERADAIRRGDTQRATQLDTALREVAADIAKMKASVNRWAKSVGDTSIASNVATAIKAGYSQIEQSVKQIAQAERDAAKSARQRARDEQKAANDSARENAKKARSQRDAANAAAAEAAAQKKAADAARKRAQAPIDRERERGDLSRRRSDLRDPLGQERARADAAARDLQRQRAAERATANEREERRRQREELAAAQRAGTPGTAEARIATERARLAASIRIQALQNEIAAVNSRQSADSTFRIWRLEREIESAKNRQLINSIKAAEQSGALPRGTLFQQVTAARRNAAGIPTAEVDAPTGREAIMGGVGQRLRSSLQFAASGALIYGGQKFIRETITEASELQSQLSLLQGQFEAAGNTGDVSFQQVKESIIETANQTGIMATQVAEIERRFMGVFRQQSASGADLGPDFGAAEEATRVAAQLAQITKLDVTLLTDELVALFKTFENTPNALPMSDIADQLVTTAQQAGITEKELLEMTSSLGPLASQLGYTSQELLGFSAVAINSSGKSASTLAENFGRVFTDLGSKQSEVLGFYRQLPELAERIPQLQELFAEGDVQGIMTMFIEDWNSMTTTMQNQFAEKVFGRREAQSVVSVFNQGARVLQLQDLGQDPDALEGRFKKRRDTVQFAIDEMERKFEEFGDALYAAGIGDAIKALLGALSGFADIATPIVKVIGEINDMLEGMPGYLLAAAAAWKLYSVAVNRATASQMFGGAGNLVMPGRGLFGPAAFAAGGRMSPYMAGATPLTGFRGVSNYGGFKPGVNAALGSRVTGGATRGLLGLSTRGGTLGALGSAGVAGIGGLATIAPMVGVMGAFIAVSAMQSRRDKWIEEVNLIAQEEEQLIRRRAEEGATEAEIRSELGPTELPNRGALDRGYDALGAGFSATVRSIGAVASAPLDVFGEGLSGFRERAGDIKADTQERMRDPLEKERERTLAEVERDQRRAILALFDGAGQKEKERRNAILENLSGNADEGLLAEMIQRYLDDPTDEEAAAAVEQIIGAAGMNKVVGPLVEAEREKQRARDDFDQFIEDSTSDEALNNLDILRRNVDTGGGRREQLLSVLRRNLTEQRRQLALASDNGNADQIREALALITETENEITEILLARFETPAYDAVSEMVTGGDPADAVRRGQERLAEVRAITPTGDSDAVRAARREVENAQGYVDRNSWSTAGANRLEEAQAGLDEALADDGVVLEEAIQTQFEIAQSIVEAKQEELNNLIDATENIQEKERLRREGINIDDNVRFALVAPQLMEGENPERVAQLADSLEISTLEVWEMIRRSLIEGDETVEAGLEMALAVAEADLAGLEETARAAASRGAGSNATWAVLAEQIAAQRSAVDAARANLEAFRGIRENVALPDANLPASTDTAAAVAAEEQKARDDAREEARQGIEQRKIAARNDPVALAKLQKESALLDLEIARQIGDRSQIAQAITADMQADAAIADTMREASRTRIQGQAAIMAAQAGGDPLAAAQAGAWEANALRGLAEGDEVAGAVAAQIEASNRVRDALQDIQRAQLEYAQARAFGDPVRQAQLALQLANYNVSAAQGEAERLRALIAQMDAQRALQQAIVDVFNAWNDIAVAQREAAGDTIGAAQLELERIKKNLDAARRQGDNMRVLELTAEQIRAEAALRDTTLQDRQSDIDFALQMQQITTGQAIAQLELLLQIPNLTKQQIQNLQLKIKQLRDDLGRDYQFNLPTELGLPTLYEVRRMNQSGGDYQAGRNGAPAAQVQDNRSYDISITASGVDAKEALRVVTDAISAPATTGTRGLGY